MPQLFVHEEGQGSTTVVLLHGAPTAIGFFRPLIDDLKSSCRILIPELPGYGHSAGIEAGTTLAVSQSLLEEALLARGAGPAALIGFSLGAYRALDLALRGRIRVSHLVTLGGFAGLPPEHRAAFRALAAQIREMPDFSAPQFRQLVAQRMVSPAFAARDPEALPAIEAWLDCTSPRALADELLAVADSDDLHSRAGSLRAPLLALVGELDAAAPVSCSEGLASRVPGARLVIERGCGHALLVEEPARTVALIRAWLGIDGARDPEANASPGADA